MSGHSPLPDKNYTVVENYFFDHVMPRVSSAEWKIICAVLRETVGWRCNDPNHSESCRRSEAEISIERFIALTGFKASQAVVRAIQNATRRAVVDRRPYQTGRQRTFRYRAVPKANLKGLERPDTSSQEPLPFISDGENHHLSPMVKITMPTLVSDGENHNPNALVLRSKKKDQDLKKPTSNRGCVGETNPWNTKPWTFEDVARHVDDCIREGQSISREATIKAILRDTTAVDHKLIEDRLRKIEARAARIRERESETKPETAQEPASPNWRGTPLEAVLESASATVDANTVETWFQCLRFEGIAEDGAILASGPARVREWLQAHYSALLTHPDGRRVQLVDRGQVAA
jgi:hypothetical protein